MMNILHITPYVGENYGGISKMVLDLVRGISQFEIKVNLATTDANGNSKIKAPLEQWIQKQGYRVLYFPSWNRDDLIFSFKLTNWLVDNIKKYDLVHLHGVFTPQLSMAGWLCQKHNIPYVITPHGMLEPWALSYKSWKKKLYYRLLEQHLLQNSNAIHALNLLEKNNIKNLIPSNRIFVIPNGIHRQEFESTPDPEIFYQQFLNTRSKTLILFLGRIDPKKGLDLLASAFAKIHHRFPNTHLIVAGPDSIGFLPTAQSYFAKQSCLDAVTFTGMLSGELKYAAFAASSLYVAPSYSEGFSMSILEAMAAGLPCTITTTCNFPEAADAKAASVVPLDANAISEALIKFLENPQIAREVGRRARDFIFADYTWNEISRKMIEQYTNIVKS